jgi:hypothetical protein
MKSIVIDSDYSVLLKYYKLSYDGRSLDVSSAQ